MSIYFNNVRTLNKIIIATLLIILSGSACAGAPTGPKKNACNGALTAAMVTHLNFGTFDGSAGGTVTIATDGTRSATAGILLAASAFSAAHITVTSTLTGCEIYPVKIRIGNTATLTEPVGSSMTASNLISNPLSGFTIIPGVAQDIFIGADLVAVAGQASGTYNTLTPYSITITH